MCPGELAELGEFPDSVLTGTGELADRTVVVYGCECGKILSFDAGAPEVLNVYSRPERVGGLDR